MTSILDLAPSTKVVKASFGDVDVPGISITGIACILRDHPQLIGLLEHEGDLNLSDLIALGADVSASFFAAGLGFPGNTDVIEKCKHFNPDDAIDIGLAILEVSFPNGPKSFLDKVQQAMESLSKQINPA